MRIRIRESDLPRALKIIESSAWLAEDVVNEEKTEEKHGKQVLIPVDFSDYSMAACEFGFNFAAKIQAEVVLMHVYFSPVYMPSLQYATENYGLPMEHELGIKSMLDSIHEQLNNLINSIKGRIQKGELPDVKYTCTLKEGVPEEEILHYAREEKPLIIIMGTRGKGEKEMDLIGSVTAEIIDRSPVFVYAIPKNAQKKNFDEIHKVAFFTSFDQRDLIAFDSLVTTFKDYHFEVSFIHLSDNAQKRTWNEIKLVGIQEYFKKQYPQLTIDYDMLGYISEKKMLELKVDKNGEGHCYTCMGCRSFLTPYVDPETGKPKYYGRFNQGVVTINLVDVALSSEGNFEKFWKIFDERLDLCHRALQARHKRLLGTPSDAAPILWQYGALARLKKGEKIDKLLFGGYSTISLGYAGLYECVKYMTGKSHTDAGAKPFALSVMQHMNDKCNQWKKAENMDYSLYGTPLESTTYKFAKCLQKRFGIVPGITDKNYITNSYHVHVSEQIDAFTKLKFESDFQRLSPGGAISYVEVPNMQDNLEAVMSVLQFIYDNIMYAELNTKSDYCQCCGYDGEIKIVEDDGKLVWECPKCGNRDQNKLNVARRTCGYIGTQFWNQGRTQEIKDRVLHL